MLEARNRAAGWIAALTLLASTAAGPAAAQDAAGIEARDTVRVLVGRWNPMTEEYTAWPDLGGEYDVAVDGTLMLPMAGVIAAEGLSAVELSERISQRLGDRMGLSGQVNATVSLAAPEPVYVVGGVENAGAYPSRPSLTVLQAVSVAGGVKGPAATFLRSERDALSTMGQYRVLELALLRNLATRARLRAELSDAEEIDTPPEVAAAPLGEELMEQERAIRDARETALESSLRQLDELETLLDERIMRIESQLVLRERQLALAQGELDDAAQLVERGLSVESRRNQIERLVADQEVRKLELETAKLSAEQRLNELGRDRLDLTNERRQRLVEALSATGLEIEKLRVQMETQAALYAESLQFGDGFVEMDRPDGLRYEITRVDGDRTEIIEAREETRLQPGDVLRVVLPMSGITAAGDTRAGSADLDLPAEITTAEDLSAPD
jgi:protein involved in polysaccharide export with SLBB domain